MNTYQVHPNVLILDYSVDRSEASLFKRWFPDGCNSSVVYVNSGDSIPAPLRYSHVMHTGSSLSIRSDTDFLEDAESLVRRCAAERIPQMGVCYGHQLICRALLGSSAVSVCPGGLEAGWIDVEVTGTGLEIPGAAPVFRVFQSHFDRVLRIPETAEVIAKNGHTEIQAFIDRKNNLFSMQFHPEFMRSEGNRLFSKEEKLLKDNGIDLQTVLDDGPSINTGNIFFGYFLNTFRNQGKVYNVDPKSMKGQIDENIGEYRA